MTVILQSSSRRENRFYLNVQYMKYVLNRIAYDFFLGGQFHSMPPYDLILKNTHCLLQNDFGSTWPCIISREVRRQVWPT